MVKALSKSKSRKIFKIAAYVVVPFVLIIAFGAWLALDHGSRRVQGTVATAAGMSKNEFEQRLKSYLLEHPEIVAEAINRLEARQGEREAAKAKTVLKSHTDEVFRDSDSPVSGNPNGDITLAEFFDYNCPYCKQMAPTMTEAEAADPRLRVVYKEFPILGPNSVFAAEAALAANEQGKYVAFHRALYQAHGQIDESKVLEVAKTVGLDIGRLKTDMQGSKISAALKKNMELARILRINGTPGFAVGDRVLTGAMNLKSLQAVIEEARQKSLKSNK